MVYVRQSSMEQVRNNVGSTASQRELAELPRRWGWLESQIRIIDADLGVSGIAVSQRAGFQELLELIDSRKVGMVIVRDVSRLSRDPLDAARFLKAAKTAGILIEANGRLYDSTTENVSEMFGLHLEGLLAWFDNANRIQTFRIARAAKARQGLAVTRPPIGYVQPVRGRWIKDPDTKVQEAVRRLFDLYLRLRSLKVVMRYLHANKLPFPRRLQGELIWEPVGRSQIYAVLTNPLYTGDYIYQRVKTTSASDTQPHRIEPRPESDWIVAKAHHEPYISHEEFETIRETLKSNRRTIRPVIGKGGALLQGLLRCGICQRWLVVDYWNRDGQARVGSYVCGRRDRWDNPVHPSLRFPARLIDQAVVREVLAALTPATMEAARAVTEHALAEQAGIAKAHARQLQQADDAVAKARQEYLLVDAKFRRIKADLATKYEEAMERYEMLKQDLVSSKPHGRVTVTTEDAAELVRLTASMEQLWRAETTTNEDRKRLLRMVISEIVVHRVSDENADCEVVWIGGLRRRLRVLRPKGVDVLVRRLCETLGKDAAAIAKELRAQGVTTVLGTPIVRDAVYASLKRLGLHRKDEQRKAGAPGSPAGRPRASGALRPLLAPEST